MKRESVRLSATDKQLIQRQAQKQGLLFSTYLRQLIRRGLEKAKREDDSVAIQAQLNQALKVLKYVLKVTLEHLFIQHALILPDQKMIIEKARTDMQAAVKELFDVSDPTEDNSEEN